MGNCSSVHQWLRSYIRVHYRRISFVGLITMCVCCPCCWVVYLSYRHFIRCRVIGRSKDRNEINDDRHDDSDDADVDHADACELPNYMFFTNKRKSEPDGDYIDVILRDWNKDYDRLESHHGFIQWLFPTWQKGVNYYSYELHSDEIELIRQDDAAMKRLLKSYEMMLDFYGIELINRETGQVQRADNWRERFHNLNRPSILTAGHTHNNLRISRILRCLRIFGLHHLQTPLVKFFLNEIIVEKTLYNCRHSCFKFWMRTMYQSELANVDNYARQLELQESTQLMTDSRAPDDDDAEPTGHCLTGTPTAVIQQSMPKMMTSLIDKIGHTEADSSSHSTEDIGENQWDALSMYKTSPSNQQQQELMTYSSSFHDDDRHHQQQNECDDTEMETVLERKDADDTFTVTDAVVSAESGNQERLKSTTAQQKVDYSLQTGRQDQEKGVETRWRQAEEQLRYRSPYTETHDEMQQHEKQHVMLDAGNRESSEKDNHKVELSEETKQELEEQTSDSRRGRIVKSDLAPMPQVDKSEMT